MPVFFTGVMYRIFYCFRKDSLTRNGKGQSCRMFVSIMVKNETEEHSVKMVVLLPNCMIVGKSVYLHTSITKDSIFNKNEENNANFRKLELGGIFMIIYYNPPSDIVILSMLSLRNNHVVFSSTFQALTSSSVG